MQEIRQEINASISQGSFRDDFIMSVSDVMTAIHKLNTGKGDGNGGLSIDHFKNSGDDSYGYLSFLFSSMLVHGAVPDNFTTSTVIPIPKGKNTNLTDSNN
jgi:hypothetical protein